MRPRMHCPMAGRRQLLLAGLLAMPLAALAAPAARYRELGWMALMPQGWDPTQGLKQLPAGIDDLQDTDPRARAMLDGLRAAWDNAPVVPALAGTDVRLPGYVVPLESTAAGVSEFLLVPYFGACIHSPPPPANQIVWCRSATPLKGLRSMDAVWASGRLQLERGSSEMGTVGYALRIDRVERQR